MKLLKFTERNVLNILVENGYHSTAIIKHKFGVGYADAARMIYILAKNRHVHHDKQKWIKTKQKTIRKKF